jgi:hypothetical protein
MAASHTPVQVGDLKILDGAFLDVLDGYISG